jgi:hypothetical protein
MKKTYTGGCQCGKVRYEAQAEIGEVITCNCSRCRKLGPLLSAVARSDFKLLAGASVRRGRSRLRFCVKRREGIPCQREQIRAQDRKDHILGKLSHDQPGHTKPAV